MVLHPLGEGSGPDRRSATSTATSPISAWRAVENTQKETAQEWLLIAQPDHAQLAGDLAARLQSPIFPPLDSDLIRAIALHDAGWAEFDAGTGRCHDPKLNDRGRPVSFLEMSPADFVVAWTRSITTAETVGAEGGIIVSRHFCRLARARLDTRIDNEEDTSRLRQFLHQERQHQDRLIDHAKRSPTELDLLTDLLQFCDLLSLYLCCGARQSVEFPQNFDGKKIRARRKDDLFRFQPAVFGAGVSLGISGRLHPETGGPKSCSLAFLLQ
jgi:hypothetical protein